MGNSGSQPKNKTGKKVVAQKIETAQKTNVLSLTEHSLEEIPDRVFQLQSLRTLDISKNKIQNLGRISQLSELKSLNCDENSLAIHSLSPLSKLPKLQSLSIGRNKLGSTSSSSKQSKPPSQPRPTSTPPSFPSLPRTIKQIKIHGNSLTSFPMQLCDPKLKSLEKLDLSNNNLASIPPEISNLSALTELNLDNNAITSLPPELGELKKLKTLSLKHNHISVHSTNFSSTNPQPIPASVFENTLLIDLNLHGNKLTSSELNEFEGFGAFMERRKKVKTKNLYGGALVDMSVCGLN